MTAPASWSLAPTVCTALPAVEPSARFAAMAPVAIGASLTSVKLTVMTAVSDNAESDAVTVSP